MECVYQHSVQCECFLSLYFFFNFGWTIRITQLYVIRLGDAWWLIIKTRQFSIFINFQSNSCHYCYISIRKKVTIYVTESQYVKFLIGIKDLLLKLNSLLKLLNSAQVADLWPCVYEYQQPFQTEKTINICLANA